jgi:hypothetical protein
MCVTEQPFELNEQLAPRVACLFPNLYRCPAYPFFPPKQVVYYIDRRDIRSSAGH